jgi:Rrf2 family transcriptional regulator, nitric oxide-sensitive transcriptional repressor
MLSRTALSAIRSLLFLAQHHSSESGYFTPRRIASSLDESPSYLAKVLRSLVKDGILRAEKGVKGGVRLSRPAGDITLLAIVEACQGTLLPEHCQSTTPEGACSLHQAALELHQGITGVLSRWTLAMLLERPVACSTTAGTLPCLMARTVYTAAGTAGVIPTETRPQTEALP